MSTRIVTIGGGTGQYHVLRALMELKGAHPLTITAIPTTMDSGGSSGILRLDYHIVAPGDISQCIFGLHPEPEKVAWLFAHRFNGGRGLDGHTVRNLIVAAALQQFGSSQKALDAIYDTFGLLGEIAPITFSNTNLNATLKDGTHLHSEEAIYEADVVSSGGIEKIWLDPEVTPNVSALSAIKRADIIIVCPGTLLCSIIPNFLVHEVQRALVASTAKKVYVANLMNRRGHVGHDWTVLDHIEYLEQFLEPAFFNVVIANTQPPSTAQEEYYREEKIVMPTVTSAPQSATCTLLGLPLLEEPSDERVSSDTSSDALAHLRATVRHDPHRLAQAFNMLL